MRGVVNTFMTPFYPSKNKGKPLEELCHKAINAAKKKDLKEISNPYQRIIARDVRDWFDKSKLIAICHRNSMTQDEIFDFRVELKKVNMEYKQYSLMIMKLALSDSPYTATLPLYKATFCIIFGCDTNVTGFQKIVKKFPQIIFLAGLLEGQLLNKDDFLRYGKMDLTTSRMHLVQLLQSAGGNNLNRQLTHHQSTLVARLKQIGTNETTSGENEESVPV